MAGSITVTPEDIGGGITKYLIAWLSDGSGAVSGNSFDVKRGWLMQSRFIPDGGDTQPTDAYDLTILDGDGIDILQGDGGNLSNAAPSAAHNPIFLPPGALTPTIAAAGAANGGQIALFVGPYAVAPAA
jgi:hypothetical protein